VIEGARIISVSHQQQPLTALQTAERRLARALEARGIAEAVEQSAETNIVRHGGPDKASAYLISRWMRSHERVFICDVEVRRWNTRLEAAMVAEHTNGGRANGR
jgi:EAL domain-containing protein (putative c-di-GMP-specific phosphodiesterase class I)